MNMARLSASFKTPGLTRFMFNEIWPIYYVSAMPLLSRDYYVGVVCFPQLFWTSCLGMAAASHRCWCLLMTHLKLMIGMSQLKVLVKAIKLAFLCSRELPFNKTYVLELSRGLDTLVLFMV